MGCGASHSAPISGVSPTSRGLLASVRVRGRVRELLPPGTVDSDGMLSGCDWDVDLEHTDPEDDQGLLLSISIDLIVFDSLGGVPSEKKAL